MALTQLAAIQAELDDQKVLTSEQSAQLQTLSKKLEMELEASNEAAAEAARLQRDLKEAEKAAEEAERAWSDRASRAEVEVRDARAEGEVVLATLAEGKASNAVLEMRITEVDVELLEAKRVSHMQPCIC